MYFSNLITAVNYHISANLLGRSKPLPYTVGYIIQFVRSTHFFSLFTFHLSLFSAVRLAPVPTVAYIFNLLTAVNYHISANSLGRSKPLPYTVGYIIQFVRSTHFFSLFTFHSSLP